MKVYELINELMKYPAGMDVVLEIPSDDMLNLIIEHSADFGKLEDLFGGSYLVGLEHEIDDDADYILLKWGIKADSLTNISSGVKGYLPESR